MQMADRLSRHGGASPGDPQAERTIAKTINGGYDLLEAKSNHRQHVSLVPLRALSIRQIRRSGNWKPRSIANPAARAGNTAAASARIFSG
jgi:hypothetical protein